MARAAGAIMNKGSSMLEGASMFKAALTGQSNGSVHGGETGKTTSLGGNTKQSHSIEEAGDSPQATRLLMDKMAADGRKDAIQAAQLAAQASRTEALAKNLKKGADAAKNLT
jgi:hypothetical protein